MNLNPSSLISFLAHRDDIVRKKVAHYFLARRIVQDEVRDLAVESFLTFDPSENLSVLHLLEIQELRKDQIKLFLNLFDKIRQVEKSSKILTSLRNIVLNHSYEILTSFRDELSLEFLGECHLEQRQREIHQEIFNLYAQKESREIWQFLKQMLVEEGLKLGNDSIWVKVQMLLEVLQEEDSKHNFPALDSKDNFPIFEVRQEIVEETVTFFKSIVENEKINLELLYFYLMCVEFFNLDLHHELLNLFSKKLPSSFYEDLVLVLASSEDERILESVSSFLYQHRDQDFPGNKILLNIFDYFSPEQGEKQLIHILKKLDFKEDLYLELLLKLADLFSLEFIEYSKVILKQSIRTHKKYLIEKNLLVYSIITGLEVPENYAFVDSYIKQSDQRSYFLEKKRSRRRLLGKNIKKGL